MSNITQSKKTAVAFYELMFNDCQPADAVAQYVGDTCIQHAPRMVDGKQGFVAYCERMAAEYPGKRATSKCFVAKGDLVVLQCLQQWPGDSDYADIAIFRFDAAGEIVEQWDVLQAVSA